MAKPKRRVLSIHVGAQVTLDLVWQDDVCLVVFAERGALQRRTIAPLHPDQAMEAARFLAQVSPLPTTAPPQDEEEETKP